MENCRTRIHLNTLSDCRHPRLKLDDRQTRDHLEVAEIAGGYAVAEFHGRHADQQIGERKTNAFRLVLTVDLSNTKSKRPRDRMSW